jgi:hypothetical protein
MNADDLNKLTTESLKELAALLEQGRSERLITLLKTMGRFHRYSLLCTPQHTALNVRHSHGRSRPVTARRDAGPFVGWLGVRDDFRSGC